MVFKPINLARQNLLKTFTHGYAQSLVAASQSSSASQNTSFHSLGSNVSTLFSKSTSHSQSQNVLSHQTSASGPSVKAAHADNAGNEGGLAAYYAAWQRHRKSEEKELHQFQFAKRIGWKAPTTIPDGQLMSKETGKRPATSSGTPRPATLTRSNTTSALDQLKQSTEQETTQITEADSLPNKLSIGRAPDATTQHTTSSAAVPDSTENRVSPFKIDRSTTSLLSEETNSSAQVTRATSLESKDSFTNQLTALAETGQYGEIPALFESMLASGTAPTPSAYNALLLAAINLPRGKHQVASKVLDVYADMLRRRVPADTSTYAILVELLAARSMDVIAMKKELSEKANRYTSAQDQDQYLLRSDETEVKILSEDDSLSMAIELFDTSAAVSAKHVFPTETYRLLISACAEVGRIGDMVRVYASMESHGITAPSAIFPSMIVAFGRGGDLKSVVDCYDVYKGLAISHNSGVNTIVRKDEEIYTAVIDAYAACGRLDRGLQFLTKIEESLGSEQPAADLRDTIYSQSIYPHWIKLGQHEEVMNHASANLGEYGQHLAFSAVAVDAAHKNLPDVAEKALYRASEVGQSNNVTEPAISLLAMYTRNGSLDGLSRTWIVLKEQTPTAAFIEPSTAFAKFLIQNGMADNAVTEASAMYSRIREQSSSSQSQSALSDRIDEAIEVLATALIESPSLSTSSAMQLIRAMADNGRAITPVTEHVLAFLGPDQVSEMSAEDVRLLAQIEASLINGKASLDVAHGSRFAHLLEIAMTSGIMFDATSTKMIEGALTRIGRQDLLTHWQSPQMPAVLPVQYPPSPAYTASSFGYEDNYDPYGSSTDFKGSAVIADELEKTNGVHAQHLQEALFRFRNMRRIGRHPRYLTYAKLIGSAAKENQLETAEDILAMAKQDVPFLAHSAVVRSGWIAILDAMVSACLTVGKRDQSARYHQDLINMGAAPSANTFGLYITTLKESTKTFDEATEAVKIFHQAKAEGVEPTSFLYNALIGKLGKARRIDDCLFYFAEMRTLGIRPTSVTYGTVVNALCRVSDDKFAEQLFEEMESCANYKPRPAPYNSLMQYFLTTKRDRTKVLNYYERMQRNHIQPTMHTYKLLIDTYATLSPIDLPAAERIIEEMQRRNLRPEAVHYAALIHAKGCVLNDMPAARQLFDDVVTSRRVKPHACLYQALFESYVANHDVAATEAILPAMKSQGVRMTAYIANTLIHGWATVKDIAKARSIYESLGREGREPSTYEAMTRANLAVGEQGEAKKIVGEALRRGYPSAVASKICELVAPSGGVVSASL